MPADLGRVRRDSLDDTLVMWRVLWVFALVAAVAAPARADERKRAHALELADESERSYKAGAFERAAALLREAHDLYPEPILLYNLGRALEGLGDARGAAAAYRQYLADAKQVDDRGAIERRVATLQTEIDQPAQAAAPPLPARVAVEPDEPKPAWRELGPWVAIGAGGAIAITGGLFGWRARSDHDDAEREPVQQTAAALQSSATSDARIANALFVAGGVLAVGGAVWEYIEWRAGDRVASGLAHVHVAPRGIALEWALP
jgi:tetratricopeptide (TPR) repeat protein